MYSFSPVLRFRDQEFYVMSPGWGRPQLCSIESRLAAPWPHLDLPGKPMLYLAVLCVYGFWKINPLFLQVSITSKKQSVQKPGSPH